MKKLIPSIAMVLVGLALGILLSGRNSAEGQGSQQTGRYKRIEVKKQLVPRDGFLSLGADVDFELPAKDCPVHISVSATGVFRNGIERPPYVIEGSVIKNSANGLVGVSSNARLTDLGSSDCISTMGLGTNEAGNLQVNLAGSCLDATEVSFCITMFY